MRWCWLVMLVGFGCSEKPYDEWVVFEGEKFSVQTLSPVYNVNDAGVGDLNNDGVLDLWTTNHSSYQWVELSPTDVGVATGAADIGLSQDVSSPGFEYGYPGDTATSAISVYADRTSIVVKTAPSSQYSSVTGRVQIPWFTEVQSHGAAIITINDCEPKKFCLDADFALSPNSSIELEPSPAPSDGFPIRVSFSEEISLDDIGIGRRGHSPEMHSVELKLRDRHGLAMADVMGTAEPEMFVSRGGARGHLLTVDRDARDELFRWTGERYVDEIVSTGIEKKGCPGRKVSWVDIDFDGDLDLYQVCGRAAGAQSEALNRLYVQKERGHFEELAAEFGLALPGSGTFAFVPDVDQQIVLVWSNEQGIELLRYNSASQRYESKWAAEVPGSSDDKLTVGDIDADGNPEVVRISKNGNYWLDKLFSTPELHKIVHPEDSGSLDGSIVDIDADGQPEIFFIPQGFYSALEDRWWPISNLEYETRSPLRRVRSNWVDLDDDGDLDLWMLAEGVFTAPRSARELNQTLPRVLQHTYQRIVELAMGRLDWHSRQWHAAKILNSESSKHTTVQLKIVGPPENSGAIGALVKIYRTDGTRQASVVGATDGSRFSQSHFRLYFGMGDMAIIKAIEVFYPDGEIVRIEGLRTERLIEVSHPRV